MIYVINLGAAIFLTYFCFESFSRLSVNAGYSLLIFFLWYTVLWLFSYVYDRRGHFAKLPKVLGFLGYYLKEVVAASLWVAYEVVTPSERVKPGIIAFPLRAKSDLEIALLANLITLTPGTLTIDVSEDRKTLYVHDIHIKEFDVEKRKKLWRDGLERRILELTRKG